VCSVCTTRSTSRSPGPETRLTVSGPTRSTGHAPRAPVTNPAPPLPVGHRRCHSHRWGHPTHSRCRPIHHRRLGSPRQWCPTILAYRVGRRPGLRPTVVPTHRAQRRPDRTQPPPPLRNCFGAVMSFSRKGMPCAPVYLVSARSTPSLLNVTASYATSRPSLLSVAASCTASIPASPPTHVFRSSD
jgi:hypothetical protein